MRQLLFAKPCAERWILPPEHGIVGRQRDDNEVDLVSKLRGMPAQATERCSRPGWALAISFGDCRERIVATYDILVCLH
jgi:hypothetical protein